MAAIDKKKTGQLSSAAARSPGTRYGYTLSFRKELERVYKDVLVKRAYALLRNRLSRMMTSFLTYYLLYRPVPSTSEPDVPGIRGKYSEGKYMKNLQIYADGVLYDDIRDIFKEDYAIPYKIVVRNHTEENGYRYSDKVEYSGWTHRSPYSPIRKALKKVRGAYKFDIKTEQIIKGVKKPYYGFVEVADSLNKTKIHRKRGVSMTKGSSIKTQRSRKARKAKK